jgi:signal transduction histidine kinase
VRILKDAGYQVVEAVDGSGALSQMRAAPPNLVLLDVGLPDISGGEVLRQIRADPALAGIMVAMLSARDVGSEQLAAALDAGAEGYLVGPIPPVELLARVRSYLRQVELIEQLRGDVTVQQVHEREILRLSRLFAALSHVNQAIATARTREELFQRVCRMLVESGGFPMAWIGWIDPETRRVAPVAQWGSLGVYVSQLDIFADDRPEGRGPVGTAIRDGSYCVSNDFDNDPRVGPWREMARSSGIRAVAAFPIRLDGTVGGAMTVLSHEAGVFQEQEIALLSEAARDLSFGLENLSREAARQQAESDLRVSDRQLHSLISRMHTVREEEAKRIARELHDDLGQKLTVLHMELEDLEGKLTGAATTQLRQIEKMRRVVDHTIEVVQKISGELRLGPLDLLGLTAAIEWNLEEFSRQAGISCRIGRLDEPPELSDLQRTTVFRILQEALTNMARHAGATEVVVNLEAEKSELVLIVRDNGRGITATELSDLKSIGLLGMRERALILGGDVKVTRNPEGGTTVRVSIPVTIPARGPA